VLRPAHEPRALAGGEQPIGAGFSALRPEPPPLPVATEDASSQDEVDTHGDRAQVPDGHLVELLHREPGDVGFVAVHAWDIHGASRAGLVTGWCSRLEHRYPAIFDPPDVSADDLHGVAAALVALEA